MRRGRKKREDNEICPRCGKPGYSYPASAWNSAYKDGPRNYYFRFIHKDRALRYCHISKSNHNYQIQVATEYLTTRNEVRKYEFIYTPSTPDGVYIHRSDSFKAITIVIYRFEKQNKLRKKLANESLKLKEIDSLLQESETYNNSKHGLALIEYRFLKNLRNIISENNTIVTFGNDAEKEADRISESKSNFVGMISYLKDECGVLAKILDKRNLRQKLSEWSGVETQDYTGIAPKMTA